MGLQIRKPLLFPLVTLSFISIKLLHSYISMLFSPSNLSIAIATIISALIVYSFSLTSNKRSSTQPPAPFVVPIFGNWLQVGNDLNHRLLASISQTYGPVFLLKLGSKNLVVVSDLELVTQVLHSQGVEFSSRPRNVVFDIFTGNGQDMIFTAYGDYWCKKWRIMTVSFFTNKVVHNYSNMWEEEMDLVVLDLIVNEKVRSEGIVIRKLLQLMLYNIMYRMMFDAKFESQEDPLFIHATRFNS